MQNSEQIVSFQLVTNNVIGSIFVCLFTFSSDLKKKVFQFVAGQPDPL